MTIWASRWASSMVIVTAQLLFSNHHIVGYIIYSKVDGKVICFRHGIQRSIWYLSYYFQEKISRDIFHTSANRKQNAISTKKGMTSFKDYR